VKLRFHGSFLFYLLLFGPAPRKIMDVRVLFLISGLILPVSVSWAQDPVASQLEAPNVAAPPTAPEVPVQEQPLSLEEALKLSFQNHGDVGSARESLAAAA
jgi:hypothetical protein